MADFEAVSYLSQSAFFMFTIVLFLPKAQAGWLQHDFGHLSVFKKSVWNHLVHKFVIGHLKVRLVPIKH